jgi:lipid A 3-O-deacylase
LNARRRGGAGVAAALALSALAPSGAAEPRHPGDSSTFTVMFENDLFGDSDAQYTNGIQIGWLSPDLERFEQADPLPGWMTGLARHLPFIDVPGSQHNVGVTLGQKMFTPDDTLARAVVPDDRPYAGWLYGGLSFISKTKTRLDAVELQAGVIGPASFAEDTQRLVHELRGFDVPQGWDNQLDNEPGLALIYEHKRRNWRSGNVSGAGYDVISHAGGAVGNVFTYLNAGAEVRVGWNLPADFGTSLITPGGDTNAPTAINDPRLDNRQRFGVHLFGAVTGRLVLRDAFLDGNTFGDSHDVDKKPLVGDLLLGVSVTFWNAKLSYAEAFRSREFEGQDSPHNFGSLSLSLTF